MVSDSRLPPAEDLDEEAVALLAAALAAGAAPAAETSGAGGKAWTAFFEIRDAPNQGLGRMSISAVTTRAKVARGPFATKGGRFRLLRQAIRDRMLLARAEDAGAASGAADEEGAVGEAAAEGGVRPGWEEQRRRQQVSDSLNAAYLARAIAAERSAEEERRKAKAYLKELNERDEREGVEA